MAGVHANPPSLGVPARDWIFEVGCGRSMVELGDKPGQWMDTRTVFLFGFRFRGGRNPA